MAFLIRCLSILFLITSIAAKVVAGHRPLLDFDYSGYIQGRFTAFLVNTAKPDGPLNDLPEPNLAGGESETMAGINRLEFTLGTHLPKPGWSIKAKGNVGGSKVGFKEAYLKWSPNPSTSYLAGIITVPFGLENSISSSLLPTTERSIIYGFGNFSWVEPLGFQVIDKEDYGLRFDCQRTIPLLGCYPFVKAAIVTGNGKNILPGLPTQLIARTGFTSKPAVGAIRFEFNLGLSGTAGWNDYEERYEYYMPVGSRGDLSTNPDNAVQIDYLGKSGRTYIIGTDIKLRLNEWVISSEWLQRKVNEHTVQGYYVQLQFELFNFIDPDIELVVKWEDAFSSYADGAHRPGTHYQVATAGINWDIVSNWRLQCHYMNIMQDCKQHVFTGSDLITTQLQWRF